MQDRPSASIAPNPTTHHQKPSRPISTTYHEGNIIKEKRNSLRALLDGGLLGGGTTGLGGSALLLLLLGKLDGGGASDGGGAEVRAVATLGGGVDDALVDLAAGGVGGEGRGLLGLGGLVGARRELGGEADGVRGVGVDADGLLVGETGPLARVLVGQVERVARKLDTSGTLTLGEERVVGACGCERPN